MHSTIVRELDTEHNNKYMLLYKSVLLLHGDKSNSGV